MLPTYRYLREYLRPGTYEIDALETTYHRGDEVREATLYRPRAGRGQPPGWIVLHGLTIPGRHHSVLQRFCRSLAATGAAVMVPDIPEWRDLRIATAVTIPTIRAALREFAERPDVDHERIGLIGFSFGATQGLIAAADPALQSTVKGIAAWGGYRDLGRSFEFGITGRHELDGVHYQLDPDPYGRWAIVSNYLTGVPGCEEYTDVAAALRELALESGRRRVYAWDPCYDPDKVRLRARLRTEHCELFDLFAPLSDRPIHDVPRAQELARGLARAALRAEPLLDPGPALAGLRIPTLIAHGRDDRIIPFTEATRLARSLPPGVLESQGVTALFAHSGGTQAGLGLLGVPREALRFIKMLDSIISFV